MTPTEYAKMVGFHSAGHIYYQEHIESYVHKIWCAPGITWHGMKYIQIGWFSTVCGLVK